MLAGLLKSGDGETTAAAVALRKLAASRVEGLSDGEIIAAHPEVLRAVADHRSPGCLVGRAEPGAPLPAAFRLGPDGQVVAVRAPGSRAKGVARGGQGAGGGRAAGPVTTPEAGISDGAVLVVRTLDPDLAVYLPRLAGLVAETGSVLSHLAILARELGVPTVVCVDGALERFPVGTTAAP